MSEPVLPNLPPDLGPESWRFGRFSDLRKLDSGGQAKVYRARDMKLGRTIALKIPQVLDDTGMFELIRETRRATELTHPSIVRVYDFHEESDIVKMHDAEFGRYAISMQYINGLDLDKLRRSPGRKQPYYTFEEIERWMAQLCDALIYLHEKGNTAHRDLKPKNIMLDKEEKFLYVMDFGIAQKIHSTTGAVTSVSSNAPTVMGGGSAVANSPTLGADATKPDTIFASLSYASYEQNMGVNLPPTAYDIYSLGATIYDLLTGKPPFHSGNREQLLSQMQLAPRVRMADRRAEFGFPDIGIPPNWEETILACIDRNPENRPKSVREVAGRLGLLATAPSDIRTSQNFASHLAPEWKWSAAAAGTILAGLAIGYFLQ